jgi:pimeloyl-ACP methyl ester carboxylesterase
MPVNVETKQLNATEYSIYYYVSGSSGKPLVIFLHPSFGDHRCFDGQLEAFSGRFRVLTVDLIGHGMSQASGTLDRIDATAEHLREIMDLEGYAEAHFVGISMGSLAAQQFALRYPRRVSSITAVGGYEIYGNSREIVTTPRWEIVKWLFLITFSMKGFRRYVAGLTVSSPEQRLKFYEISTCVKRKSMRVLTGFHAFPHPGPNYRLNKPLLLLCGEQDLDMAKKASEHWHGKEAQSRYGLIANAGHCANMDQPEAFNQTVLDFLSDL